MELHFQYLERVQAANQSTDDEDEDDDEVYLRKLDAGLFTLQLIDYIILEIASNNANIPSIRQRVLQILNLRNSSIENIKEIVRGEFDFFSSVSRRISISCVFVSVLIEYAENLGTSKKTNGVDHSSTDANANGNSDDPFKQHLHELIENSN